MDWTTAQVRRGQTLLKKGEDAKWGLGDLALEVAPVGEDHAPTGRYAILDAFADEIGIEPATLRRLSARREALVMGSLSEQSNYMVPTLAPDLEPTPIPSDAAKMLAEFHAAVAHPDTDLCWLRDTLHEEENKELCEALAELDAAKSDTALWAAQKHVAKELADVVYVAYGTAHGLGINLDVALRRVHESNMRKAGGPRRADGKVMKPPGWTPPYMADALRSRS